MAHRPFRFIHAGDFHLERPLAGVAEVPDHLRELFLESPYTAARRVFDAALTEDVQFVVLTGGICTPSLSGPRGPLFLAEQFVRLAQRGIGVYWAGSMIDLPDAWPAAVRLPQNVHFFPQGRVEELMVQDSAGPLARLAGTSCDDRRPWRAADFQPGAEGDPKGDSPIFAGAKIGTVPTAGLYTIAVAHGEIDLAVAQTRGLHYWALGGRHDRSTPLTGPQAVHYCGTTQGRRPDEAGVHGCTLVQVDEQRQTRTSLIPTDAVRWMGERLAIDDGTTAADLETRLRDRLGALVDGAPNVATLISWTLSGHGPLLGPLRRGTLAGELLQRLRGDYGYRSPPAWSVSLGVEPAEMLPPEWYEQETIRGDFLRAIRRLQMNPGEPLGLDRYVSEPHRAGTLAALVALDAGPPRDGVLREAAALGVELLSGETENGTVPFSLTRKSGQSREEGTP
jgi:DNA repair protein SbcD/Mre11